MRTQFSYKLVGVFVLGLITGAILLSIFRNSTEGFQGTTAPSPTCNQCGAAACPPVPDLSKYVLKTSIPAPSRCPDMSQYMLKTECPPVPDLSQYVLKSSVPTADPVIIDNSQCGKQCGECPACPRPRCPEIKCPPPTVCPACPPCARQTCPQTTVKCKAEENPATPVRPYLAPLNFDTFGR
jgi:hypothetical protein